MTDPFDDLANDDPEDSKEAARILSNEMDDAERSSFGSIWPYTARDDQLPPDGRWRIWMIMAGRGFGKTRSGAEWVRMIADRHPNARIALVSSSLAEARAVMVEGESGLLAICRPGHKPHFEPSLNRIRFRSGAQAQLFSAAEPEALRGPQDSHACRAGSEGVLRQRGAVRARRAPRPRGDGLAARPAHERCRRRVLPGDGDRDRGMGGAGGSACGPCRGAWHFIAPVDSMVVFDRAAARMVIYQSQWEPAVVVAAASGGTVIDVQARATLTALIAALNNMGVLAAPPA